MATSRRLVEITGAWVSVALVSAALRLTVGPPVHTGAMRVIAIAITSHLIWVPVTLAVAVIIDRWPIDGSTRTKGIAALSASLAAVVIAQPEWWNIVAGRLGVHTLGYLMTALDQLDTNFVRFAAAAAVLWALRSYERSVDAELAAVRLERALSEVQGQLLTLQLQPHFLFNALHAVSEIVYDDARAAHQMLLDLRGLLAESFSSVPGSEVTVADELRFLEQYAAIQRRRFRDRLTVHVTAERDVRSALLPHLLLQPLVENAIRHGIAPRASGGTVSVVIAREGATLLISVIDDGVGLQRDAGGSEHGFGVSHSKLRLSALYGDRAEITLRNRTPTGVETRVTIPYHTTPRASVVPGGRAGVGPDDVGPVPPPAVWNPGRPARIAAILAAWATAAVMWTQIGMLGDLVSSEHRMTWLASLKSHLVVAAWGAALTLPVWWLAKRYPWREGRVGRALLAQGAIALAVSAANVFLAESTLRLLAPIADFARLSAPDFRASAVGWGMWNLLVYAAAVAFANRLVFVEWHRARRLDAAKLAATIARTRTDLARLQLQPAVLLAALDEVTAASDRDPAVCDEMIARLGDELRAMLYRPVVELGVTRAELRAAS